MIWLIRYIRLLKGGKENKNKVSLYLSKVGNVILTTTKILSEDKKRVNYSLNKL